MWVAVTILFLLFTACGVFMVLLQKDEEEKNIHYFLTRNRLNNSVSYQDLSLSVSDAAVLKNVSVRLNALPGLANKTDEFAVHDYKESGHIATRLSFSARNVSFQLVDIARILKNQMKALLILWLFQSGGGHFKFPAVRRHAGRLQQRFRQCQR